MKGVGPQLHGAGPGAQSAVNIAAPNQLAERDVRKA